jgi:UPF0176 protein
VVIIEYTRQVKKKVWANSLVKNFVFDHRLGERITDDISQCHQCGRFAMYIINCVNEGCHFAFLYNVNVQLMEGCCLQLVSM